MLGHPQVDNWSSHVVSSVGPLQIAPSIAEQAEAVVRRLIIDGVFAPGQRLNEAELSQSLGISRSPLREAFQRLSKEGIVTLIPNRGAFVTEFDLEQISQLYEVRNALEIEVARLAAMRADEQDLGLMRQAIAATRLALEHKSPSYPPDTDFHQHLIDAVRNPLLADSVTKVDSQLRLVRARAGFVPARAVAAYEEHVAIYEAVESRDSDRAASEMRKHLENCLTNLSCILMPPDAVR